MTCCDHCQESGEFFNRKTAEKELRKYRKNGPPNKSTRLLIDALKTLDIQDRTLLDIGGGVGMIQHELLQAGVETSTLVEASPAYMEVAQNESRRRGHADRTSFKFGDFVDLAPDLPEADIVTLDRVYCCYPHMQRLAEASTDKALRWYGVVYPKAQWFIRAVGNLGNAYCWFRGRDFRIYFHEAIDETICDCGFEPFYQVETFLWKVALYEREEVQS